MNLIYDDSSERQASFLQTIEKICGLFQGGSFRPGDEQKGSGLPAKDMHDLFGSASVFLFFIPLLKKFLRPAFDSKAFRIYFAFGFPIIFSSLGKILNDMSGRWLLDRMVGAEEVAYFAAGFRLASVANLAVAAFTLAWDAIKL